MCGTVLTLPKPWCQGQIEGLKDKLNIKAASLQNKKKWKNGNEACVVLKTSSRCKLFRNHQSSKKKGNRIIE